MRKAEIKTAADNEIIMDAITSYAIACVNENVGLATKAINKHLCDLEAEMLRRGLLTEEQVEKLNQ